MKNGLLLFLLLTLLFAINSCKDNPGNPGNDPLYQKVEKDIQAKFSPDVIMDSNVFVVSVPTDCSINNSSYFVIDGRKVGIDSIRKDNNSYYLTAIFPSGLRIGKMYVVTRDTAYKCFERIIIINFNNVVMTRNKLLARMTIKGNGFNFLSAEKLKILVNNVELSLDKYKNEITDTTISYLPDNYEKNKEYKVTLAYEDQKKEITKIFDLDAGTYSTGTFTFGGMTAIYKCSKTHYSQAGGNSTTSWTDTSDFGHLINLNKNPDEYMPNIDNRLYFPQYIPFNGGHAVISIDFNFLTTNSGTLNISGDNYDIYTFKDGVSSYDFFDIDIRDIPFIITDSTIEANVEGLDVQNHIKNLNHEYHYSFITAHPSEEETHEIVGLPKFYSDSYLRLKIYK